MNYSTCHPDKRRWTRAGLCQNCHKRAVYVHRPRAKASEIVHDPISPLFEEVLERVGALKKASLRPDIDWYKHPICGFATNTIARAYVHTVTCSRYPQLVPTFGYGLATVFVIRNEHEAQKVA